MEVDEIKARVAAPESSTEKYLPISADIRRPISRFAVLSEWRARSKHPLRWVLRYGRFSSKCGIGDHKRLNAVYETNCPCTAVSAVVTEASATISIRAVQSSSALAT